MSVSTRLSRRDILAGSAASAGGAALAPLTRPARAAGVPLRLVAGTRILDVDGRPAKVFSLVGPDGRPGIILAPGRRFHVDLANETGTRTIVHWHGQLPPWTQDGFPWAETPLLPQGATQVYDYAPIAGTYWMHSHGGLQEQSLLAAPLIVHSAADLREDRQEIVMMLHDFSFRAPDVLLAGLTGLTPAQAHALSREVENVPSPEAPAGGMAPGAPVCGSHAGHMAMLGMGSRMPMDLNDIPYDAFLANDRTLADPEVIRIAPGGRVRLRIINGASASQFWIDLGALVGRVVAADGHPVHPVSGRRFPIATAQRLDILLDLPSSGAFPILAHAEGTRSRAGIILATRNAPVARIAATTPDTAPPLDNSLEARLSAVHPLASRRPDLVHRIVLAGGMKPYAWSLNGQYWPHIEPLMLGEGQRVEIELVNHSMMPHPMHLHGHAFQVLALNGRLVQGAVRDTVLVPPGMKSVRIAFDAVNPGRWAFHCHNLYHMATGMMTEFRYHGIV